MDSQRLNRELVAWKDLDHPGIAEFFGVSFSFGRLPALISRWYRNGDVKNYLIAHPDVNRLQMVSTPTFTDEFYVEKWEKSCAR